MKLKPMFKVAAGLAVVFSTSGCFIGLDDGEDDFYYEASYPHTEYPNREVDYCETYGWCSGESEDTVKESNCFGLECKSVDVVVNYLLSDDLGKSKTLKIEAFEDPEFSTNPVASISVFQFDASRPGTTVKEKMQLDTGEYYFRAYLTSENGSVVPYEYRGMKLVSDAPVGVFGLLGVAQKVTIDHESGSVQDVVISLDRLFKPEDMRQTDAFLRLKVEIDPLFAVTEETDLWIQLFDSPDFAYKPVAAYKVSALSLNEETEFKTEFISPQLDEGDFYLRVYMDVSKNGYFDELEPVYVHSMYGQTQSIRIIANRTETVKASLE